MRASTKYLWFRLLLLPFCVSVAFAQNETPAPPPERVYSPAELDQLLAPIALYPDSLLSQILMAATYPLEVVEAARWARANPNLKGEDAVRAVNDRDWDPSVKSLVAFPQIITMMDSKLEWTERLGDAFLAQETQVMDTVQGLRKKASAAGNLQSNDRQRVEQQDGNITIEPANPTVVYVPYYDPTVAYGPWWWPAYPPVYWAPWPGYYVYPGFVGFAWGFGIGISANFFFGICDWHRHAIRIVDARPFFFRRVDRHPFPHARFWHHSPEHRRGVPYRNVVVRERFRHIAGSPVQRRIFHGSAPRMPEARSEPGDRTATRPAFGDRGRRVDRRDAPPLVNTEKMRVGTPMMRTAPARPQTTVPTVRRGREVEPREVEAAGRGRDVRRFSERGLARSQSRGEVRSAAPAQQLWDRGARSDGWRGNGGMSFRQR